MGFGVDEGGVDDVAFASAPDSAVNVYISHTLA